MTPSPPTSRSPIFLRRGAALLLIALGAWFFAILIPRLIPSAIAGADNLFYDTYYKTRPITDMTHADVLLVVADQASIEQVDKHFKKGWPWPREFWGDIAAYTAKAGAKALAFDIVFTETSVYQDVTGDDDLFADTIKSLKTPVVFGSAVKPDGSWERFAPAIPNPHMGAVNIGNDKMFRQYPPTVLGKPSLALAALQAAGDPPRLPIVPPAPLTQPGPAPPPNAFNLHYYGPYIHAGRTTFQYVSAYKVLGAQVDGKAGEKAYGISPDMFRGKIVIFGAIAAGAYDLKVSPLSAEYPGSEVQATAIENLLRGDSVRRAGSLWLWIIPLLAALAVSAGVIIPRHAIFKLFAPFLAVAILIAAGIWLFQGSSTIVWFPPTPSLLAIAAATLAAFAWTYFAEDRQRRFMLKALSKVVSPAVAEQLAREPHRLALGTARGELTLLFTDLADFTALAEGMDVQHLGEMLNRYLGEMSDQVLAQDGTLDKYIGDAVMCFWNAPLPQGDHADRACRAALAMVAREKVLRQDFAALGTKKLFTRIGINSAPVAVGFVGSSHLFNYTALGDGVNLASRVEGANKLYGTQILITENTAALVKDRFHLRKIDVVRVKGKREPMALYQLLAARGPSAEPRLDQLSRLYESAFAAYQKQTWDDAQRQLLELLESFGEDGPARALLKRIASLRGKPLDPNWDGVFESTEK